MKECANLNKNILYQMSWYFIDDFQLYLIHVSIVLITIAISFPLTLFIIIKITRETK